MNQSITTSFLGSISGSGGLTKQGGGTLILDGVNSYTGGTSVDGGTLEIGDADHTTASLAGPVTVGADGNLAGHGTIGGDVANIDGGTVSPGGSIGTLTVAGNYTQGPSSTLVIEVSPTAASQLHVLGNASLAGTLDMVYEPGIYSQASYDILQAGSITGTFATVTGNTPRGFDQSLTYGPTLGHPGRRSQRAHHRRPDQRHDLHGAQHRRLAGGAAGQWRAADPYGRAASRHRQPEGADGAGRHHADASRLRRHRRPAGRSAAGDPPGGRARWAAGSRPSAASPASTAASAPPASTPRPAASSPASTRR